MSFSQGGLLQDIPLTERLSKASVVIEAEVVSERCFWDKGHASIYTAYTLRPFVAFKGEVVQVIELVKRGGFIDLIGMMESPTLELAIGDIGIFMLEPSSVIESNQTTISAPQYRGVIGPLSIIHEDRVTKKFTDRLTDYGYRSSLLSAISSAFGSEPLVKAVRDVSSIQPSSMLSPVNSFSPQTITAGTLSLLTINGSGFGMSPGIVYFSNANSGGQNFTPAQYFEVLSWSDTEVVVQVPSYAGTGPIVLTTEAGENLFSNNDLQVNYAQTTIVSGFTGEFKTYRTRHADTDGNGGYVWQMFSDFAANGSAADAFSRALESWSCTSGINWELGANTSVDTIALDGVNVVRFDTGNELSGAIGVCTSYYSGCGNGAGDVEWYVSELDIVFDTQTNWNFGPESTSGASIDFESVALHELGHGHQLGHVIDQGNDVMHFLIFNSTDLRAPSANNIVASSDVSSRSVIGPVCNTSAMESIECGTICPGDLNGDSAITIDDFLIFSSAFGMSCTCPADINGNGTVTIEDFLIFSSAFGSSCD